MTKYNSGKSKEWKKKETKSLELLIGTMSYTQITKKLNNMYKKDRSVSSIESKARRMLKKN